MSWLEEKGQDILTGALPFISFFLLILLSSYGYEQIGVAAYFTVIIVGIFGTELYYFYKTAKFNYIQAIVRPQNIKLHMFVQSATAKKIGDGLYAAELNLAFPVRYLDYGKVKRVKLHYRGDWSKRVDFKPGWAVYRGYALRHPQTEVIEVYQVSKGSTSVDHGEAIPVFFMHSASKDCFYEGIATPSLSANPTLLEAYEAKIKMLEAENADLRDRAAQWQQTAIMYEGIVEQQKAEIKGLLEVKTGIKELTHENLLSLYQAAGSIEAALKHIKGSKMPTLSKYLAYVLIAGMVVAFLWANPQIIQQLIYFMQTPNGTIVSIILIVVLGYVLYRVMVKGK